MIEPWRRDLQALEVFERRVLRTIFGGVQKNSVCVLLHSTANPAFRMWPKPENPLFSHIRASVVVGMCRTLNDHNRGDNEH